jgi:hypothetical protein
MALGVLASIILIAVVATLNPFDYTENVTHSDRISIAVQSGILVAFCLAKYLLVDWLRNVHEIT